MDPLKARIEQASLITPDPLGVRQGTTKILRSSRFVSIAAEGLAKFSQILKKKIINKQLLTASQLGRVQVVPQRVFLQDVVNFCFWGKKGESKWAVEYPLGVVVDGWMALVACFDRALSEGLPLLNADFLATITHADVKHVFRSNNQTEISLLSERLANLREAGKILNSRFGGNFINLMQEAGQDSIRIAQLVIEAFPSFKDLAVVNGQEVRLFKRAQICAYDLSFLSSLKIRHLEVLTVFADYKLPQVLRHFGVLKYNDALSQKVDNLEILPAGSREEVEIRAATIWAGELLAQRLGVLPVTIDNAIWSMGKTAGMKPYHRTLTTNY